MNADTVYSLPHVQYQYKVGTHHADTGKVAPMKACGVSSRWLRLGPKLPWHANPTVETWQPNSTFVLCLSERKFSLPAGGDSLNSIFKMGNQKNCWLLEYKTYTNPLTTDSHINICEFETRKKGTLLFICFITFIFFLWTGSLSQMSQSNSALPLHGMVRIGTTQVRTSHFSSAQFAFPLQFGTTSKSVGFWIIIIVALPLLPWRHQRSDTNKRTTQDQWNTSEGSKTKYF